MITFTITCVFFELYILISDIFDELILLIGTENATEQKNLFKGTMNVSIHNLKWLPYFC